MNKDVVYPILIDILDHCKDTIDRDYFIPHALREIRQNAHDSAKVNGITKPEIFFAGCVDPLGTDNEYVFGANNAAPFKDLEMLKECLRLGASGKQTGRQGVGILAAGLKFAQGSHLDTEIIYISRNPQDKAAYFGARATIDKHNVMQINELNSVELKKWLGGLQTWLKITHREKADKESSFFDTSNVFSIFRFKRGDSVRNKTKRSDSSPINCKHIGLLMSLSEKGCGECNVFALLSMMFGSQHYIDKGTGGYLGRGLRPENTTDGGYLGKISEQPSTMTFKNLLSTKDKESESRGLISLYDAEIKWRKVNYISSGGARFFRSIGHFEIIEHHRAKPPQVALTVTVESQHCSRSKTELICDPVYIEEITNASSGFMYEFGLPPIKRSQPKERNSPNMDEFHKDAKKLLGFDLPTSDPDSKNKPDAKEGTTYCFDVDIFTMAEIVIKPHIPTESIPGSVWCDFYTKRPNALRKFLRDMFQQIGQKLANPGTARDLIAFNDYVKAWRKLYAEMNQAADGIPPFQTTKLSNTKGKIGVKVFDKENCKFANNPITEIPVSYIDEQSLLVGFYDEKDPDTWINPDAIGVNGADPVGVTIVTKKTRQYLSKYGFPLAELVISPLQIVNRLNKQIISCDDAEDFKRQYKQIEHRYCPHRHVNVGYNRGFYTLSFVITEIPVVTSNESSANNKKKNQPGDDDSKYDFNFVEDRKNPERVGKFINGVFHPCSTFRELVKISGFPRNDPDPGVQSLYRKYSNLGVELCQRMYAYRQRVEKNIDCDIENPEIKTRGFESGLDFIYNEVALQLFDLLLGGIIRDMQQYVANPIPAIDEQPIAAEDEDLIESVA